MSEMHEFIKSKLGRSSSRLVTSFKKHLEKHHSPDACDNLTWWNAEYPHWIKTVRQKPSKITPENGHKIPREQLYRVISRQQDEIKQLKQELEKALRQKQRYQAPPAKVLEALAVYGD